MVECILYVRDQIKSTDFYKAVLKNDPVLIVPGMSRFLINDQTCLGLMPLDGISRLLGEQCIRPVDEAVAPRSELYIHVSDAKGYLIRALDTGATLLSPLMDRDWGDKAAYIKDIDGHIIAFAEKINQKT